MQKINLLLNVACLLLAGTSFGQISEVYWNTGEDTLNLNNACSNTVGIYLHNEPLAQNGVIITIDWGDGNTTTETVNTTANTIYRDFFTHGYAQAGIYTASLSVWSPLQNSFVGNHTDQHLNAVTPANCGGMFIYTYQTSPYLDYPDALYDFTDVNGATTTIAPYSSVQWGNYAGLNVANGPYTVSLNDTWLATNGLTEATPDFTITFPNGDREASPYFAEVVVTCAVAATAPDFGITLAYGANFVAPLQTGAVVLKVCNYACTDVSDARITLNFPDGLVPVPDGLTNAVITGNSLSFDLIGVEVCETITIPFTFDGATPAGTLLSFEASVAGITETDTNPNNDYQDFFNYVLNSLDPNDKSCNKPANIDPTVAEELQYVIRFQNDGNLEAYNIVVRDTISALLDLSTFEVLGSKHAMSYSIDPQTRVATFTFNNIYLTPSDEDLDASQGYLVYKIKENENLPAGSEIKNTAYIYFDFNPAIITNTTSNTNVDPLSVDELSGIAVQVFPNPASNLLNIYTGGLQSVRILDFTGKVLLESGNQQSINTSALSNGVYVLQVTSAKGWAVQKLHIQQ